MPSLPGDRHPLNEASAGYFHHTCSLVESESIGSGTRIWAFAHILPGAIIGRDCNICDHTFIENAVRLGDRVTVKSGVQLWDGVVLEDDVFIGPSVTFTNDRFPRSGHHSGQYPRTVVKRGASVGANSTILPGITIGERAMVGAGSVVTRDVPPDTIVVGNPASITGYVGTRPALPAIVPRPGEFMEPGFHATRVREVTLHRLPLVEDLRGSLTFGEVADHVPFPVARYFLVFEVSSREIRGEHAHRMCHQFLICVHGSCHCVADDAETREEFALDHPTIGLHIPPMCWSEQYKYSPDAVLLVLASHRYDPADYIRDYDEFLALRRTQPHGPA